jgi:hypothetical protein
MLRQNKYIYFNIKLYENKSGHYKHIYFNIKLHENESGHYCNLGNDWYSYRVPINSVKVVIIIYQQIFV